MIGKRAGMVAASALVLASCTTCGGSADIVRVDGAGATFPSPIYTKWTTEYTRLHPGVRINYQSVGSGAGISQLRNRTVFFGATDQPIRDAVGMTDRPILHIPTVVGAVVPIYNLPEMRTGLRLTGPVLAAIALGRITRWNDPALVALNSQLRLLDRPLTFVHRSDGSGTTFIWSDYLSKNSTEFRDRIGTDAALDWPAGVGAKGSEGVAGLVRQTPESLGYVEPAFAARDTVAVAAVRNAAGRWVEASPASVAAAAAEAARHMPDGFAFSITDSADPAAYPISSFTWILLDERPQDMRAALAMANFMRWALTEGQQYALGLGYAPLPAAVAVRALQDLDRIRLDN